MDISIRNELESDFREVEELTREAFWNLYVPGCDEHYLVHKMRSHPDFIRGLDFVAVDGDRIVGNIMYTKSYIVDELNNRFETVTFGPLSVLPEYQRQGIGTALIQHSERIVIGNGCKAILIYGSTHNYCKHGFKSCRDYNISNAAGKYPLGLLVLELEPGALRGHAGRFHTSDVYNLDEEAAKEYDRQFPFKKKERKHSQEEFSITIRAYVI